MLRARRRWVILPAISVIAGCSLLASSEFGDFQGGTGADGGTTANDGSPGADTSCTSCSDSNTSTVDAASDAGEDAATVDSGPSGPTTLVFERTDGGAVVADTMLQSQFPTTPGGAEQSIQVDYGVGTTTDSVVALMRFDVSTIPPGSTITAATLTLNITNLTTGGTPFDLRILVRPWSESQATWNESMTGTTWGGGGARGLDGGAPDRSTAVFATLKPPVTGKLDIPFDASGIAVVQKWVNDPTNNFGFQFDTKNNSDGISFTSSESEMPPRLSITFTPPGVDGG